MFGDIDTSTDAELHSDAGEAGGSPALMNLGSPTERLAVAVAVAVATVMLVLLALPGAWRLRVTGVRVTFLDWTCGV